MQNNPAMMFAVEMLNITRRFGATLANDDVTFRVRGGEIHALVGENGAGKSTLMNLLFGIDQPNGGEIRINGQTEILKTPAKAIKLGVGMVHQHFMLIPPLSVTENIILGNEPASAIGALDIPRAVLTIQQLSNLYHFNIDPNETLGSLSVGAQQRVEILKLLYRNADIIILDEPTAILTPREVEEFFQILKKLKEENKTIIFISHKVTEVLAISDRITVMRKGKIIGDFETSSITGSELARIMVGKEVGSALEKITGFQKSPRLQVEHLSCQNNKNLAALNDVSFTVQSGEILGIAAVEGNGQSELIEALTGLRNPKSGAMMVDGTNMSDNRNRSPLAHVPEDRLKHGLVLDFTLEENFLLGRQRDVLYSSLFGLNLQRIREDAKLNIRKYDIFPSSPTNRARELSGGNQQKFVIARELSKNAHVIIASQPTRGLDVGATEFVHRALLQERNNGKAILLVSSDLSELLMLSDRIAVLYNGEIVSIVDARESTEREIGEFMLGAFLKNHTSAN
ncbi:MAG: ABC transporter ATP-binding protein [Bacteroidota bacterium]